MSDSASFVGRTGPVRTWFALGLFGVVYFASRQIATDAAAGIHTSWSVALLDKAETFAALASVASLLVVSARRIERRLRRRGTILLAWLGLTLVSAPIYAAVRTLMSWLPRLADDGGASFAARFGPGLRSAGSTYLVIAAVVVIGDWGFRSYDTFVRERVAAARLAQELEREQLANLSLRLDPEFVVGAIASIRRRLPIAPAAAEDLLLELGDLLRRMLESDPEGRWPLREEIRFAAGYLHLALAASPAGHGTPLALNETTRDTEVPTFLLRPWLEAAAALARRESTPPLLAEIEATRIGEPLGVELTLRTAGGTPLAMSRAERASALDTIDRRLRARFGDAVQVESTGAAESSFKVRLTLGTPGAATSNVASAAGTAGEVVWKRA